MSQIDSGQCQPYATKNQLKPPDAEGPKAVPVQMDFSQAAVFNLDLSQLSDRGFFTLLQGIFVDNSLNASAITVKVDDQIGQSIVCPAAAQGYFPVLCTMPIRLVFSSAGNVVVKVDLLNFPVAVAVWKV